MNLAEISDAEWTSLADADLSTSEALQGLPLTELWLLSALHQARPITEISTLIKLVSLCISTVFLLLPAGLSNLVVAGLSNPVQQS